MAHNVTFPFSSQPPLSQIPRLFSPLSFGGSPSLNDTTSSPGAKLSVVSNNASTTVGALILCLVFLVGVPGNLFIIWSILARARKHSVTTLLILNLACADGSLMALTFLFVIYLVKQSWVFGDVMCKVLFYLCLANMYASILLITLMSLHRLVAVVWPHRAKRLTGRRTVRRVLPVLWVVVFAMSVPVLVFRKIEVDTNGLLKCNLVYAHFRNAVFQDTFETVMGFVLPYGVIVASYIGILRHIRQTRFRRRVRTENLILAIVVTFGIFWLPYHVVNMLQVVAELLPENSATKNKLAQIWSFSRVATSCLAFISSCANPVLYTFVGKSYIKKDGLAFMARLFEGTAQDSGTRRSQNSRDRERDGEGAELKEKGSDSCVDIHANTLKNGK